MCVHMRAVHAGVTLSYTLLAASFKLAQEQLALYTIPGSIQPPNSLSTSLEGSVIEMKPATPVPVDTMVNLKAQLAKSGHNLRMKQFYRNLAF